MNPDFKQKWLKALRSGEFRQGAGACCRADGSCCVLGVLARVLEKDGLVEISPTISTDTLTIRDVADAGFGCRTFLPGTVLRSLQIGTNEEAGLICMNDQDRRSFESIANYIEANL